MDSGQLEGVYFKSDVCQFVRVEHFPRKTHLQDGRQKIKEFSIVSLSAFTKQYLQVQSNKIQVY